MAADVKHSDAKQPPPPGAAGHRRPAPQPPPQPQPPQPSTMVDTVTSFYDVLVPCMRNLPQRLHHAFIDTCIPAFQLYLNACDAADANAKVRAIRKILFIPRVCLPQAHCADLHARARHNLRARRLLEACTALLKRPFEVHSIADAAREVHREHVPVPHDPLLDRPDEPPNSADFEIAKRCFNAIAHVREGHVGRAFRALQNNTAAPATVETLRQLQALHPPQSQPVPAPPNHAPRVAVDTATACRVIKTRVANGSAPGLSGWTGELLNIAASNSVCAKGIAALIADILHGTLPDDAHALLTAGRLIALLKPNRSVRPIAISEPLLKAAQQYGMQTVNPTLLFANSPQLGAGVPNGVETAAHDTAGALVEGGHEAVLLACDWGNAFNTRSRRAIAIEFYKNAHTEPLQRLFHWLYRQPATMVYYDRDGTRIGTCISAEGVRQGDPMSPLAYSVSTLDLLRQLAARPGATVRAVADDISVVHRTWRDALDTFIALQQLQQHNEGLNLNIEKCALVWPHGTPPPQDMVDACARVGLKITTQTKLLGGIVTYSSKARAVFVGKFVDDAIKQLQPLRHPAMPAQYAMRMLTSNALPKMQYLMRITPPSPGVTAQFGRYDAEVIDILAAKLKIAPELLRERHTLLRIGEKHGGLGIPSSAELHPCAYLASYLLHLRHKPEPPGDGIPPPCIYRGQIVYDGPRYAERAARYIRANTHGLPEDVLPTNPLLMFKKYRKIGTPARASKHEFGRHLQRTLINAMHYKLFDEMCNLSRDQPGHRKRAARFHTLLMHRAGRWLSAPLDDGNHLTDDEFSLCVRLRLGLPLVNDMPDRCPLCKEDSSAPDNSDHLLYCRATEKAYIDRHDDVIQTLKRIADQYARAKAEPAADHRAPRDVRPDLVIRHPHGAFYTDVQIVHPCAPSYERTRPESLLRSKGRAKTKKYKEYVALQGGDFHPFIVTTFGTMGAGCAEFFNLIRRLAANSNPSDPMAGPKAVGVARATVAVAIQRAVASATLDALFAARISQHDKEPDGGWRSLHPRSQATYFLNNVVSNARR